MIEPGNIGNENFVRCGFRDCYQCCLDTEMLLSRDDLERIEKAGHKREDFTLPTDEADGFYQLRNIASPIGNKCYFLSDKGKCSIYPIAPKGCKLYPLILNLETNETMIDYDCREQNWFRKQTFIESQIISVHALVNTLLLENEEILD
ncbi:MAG: YkgJ family cysteine cluster protein [Candidatus Kariarchaeaceae archaeon]|jgi:Fe-S-cluster containining protein